jgi:hypothetical protein
MKTKAVTIIGAVVVHGSALAGPGPQDSPAIRKASVENKTTTVSSFVQKAPVAEKSTVKAPPQRSFAAGARGGAW